MMPEMEYKNIPLDAPVAITMAAADWLVIMSWFNSHDTDGINYLIYSRIAPQLTDACYTPASIKAAKAAYHDQAEQSPTIGLRIPAEGGMPQVIFGSSGGVRPEDFTDNDATAFLKCDTCGRVPNLFTAPCPDCKDYQ